MYTDRNFKTKKQLKEAVAAGSEVTIYDPSPFGTGEIRDGEYSVEGPHSPRPHTWYARVQVLNGVVVKVK